mgnify:CR=1 FL=1
MFCHYSKWQKTLHSAIYFSYNVDPMVNFFFNLRTFTHNFHGGVAGAMCVTSQHTGEDLACVKLRDS